MSLVDWIIAIPLVLIFLGMIADAIWSVCRVAWDVLSGQNKLPRSGSDWTDWAP